jgi:DNA mismatch repair ATPase MutS
MLRELYVQIPDLLKISPTNQEPNQIKDFTIDLEIDAFLSEIFGRPAILARTFPGHSDLRSLLQNSFAEKAVVEFRQGIFDEIYQRSLERRLDHIASDLSFSASDIPKYPDESPSQYLTRQEAELGERVDRFKTAIESLDSLLRDATSNGLQQLHRFATNIRKSEEFQEIEQRFKEYVQSCRKSDSSFWTRIISKHVKSKYELIRKEKEERFKFLQERSKLKEFENQIKVYTTVARFFRKLTGIGADICLPKMLDSRQRCAKIIDVINPILAAIKGNGVVPNDIYYSPDKDIYVITGPNNGGKTTFVKTIGLAVLLAHAGFYISAKSAEISVVDNIFTQFVKPGDLAKGEGRYFAELRRIKTIFEKATPYSLAILDEPCSGTSNEEGVEQSIIILEGFYKLGCTVYFITHMHEIARRIAGNSLRGMANLSVGIEFNDGRPIFDYKIREGTGQKSYGVELAETIGLGSKQLDRLIRKRAAKGELPSGDTRIN